jgi:hypothetical protein
MTVFKTLPMGHNFDTCEASLILNDSVEELKEADLWISIDVSGIFDEVFDACKASGTEPHTVNMSLGTWRKTELLPARGLGVVHNVRPRHDISKTRGEPDRHCQEEGHHSRGSGCRAREAAYVQHLQHRRGGSDSARERLKPPFSLCLQ